MFKIQDRILENTKEEKLTNKIRQQGIVSKVPKSVTYKLSAIVIKNV